MPKWRHITIEGVTYRTLSDACRALNLAEHLAYGRINRGWTIEEALGLAPRKSRNRPQKMVVEGIEYSSISEASRKYELDDTLVGYRLKSGWSVEQAFELAPPPTKSLDKAQMNRAELMGCVYLITNEQNGKKYVGISATTAENRWKGHVSGASNDAAPLSISKAILEYGENAFSLRVIESASLDKLPSLEKKYIKEMNTLAPTGYNLSLGGQLGSYLGINCELHGVQYPSISALARAYNVEPDRVKKRVFDGWTLLEAVGLEKRNIYKRTNPIHVGDRDFNNFREAADYFKIPYKVVRARSSEGWSLEEIFEITTRDGLARRQRVYFVNGNEYRSMKDLADAFHLSPAVVSSRFSMGWTAEEAVGLKTRPRFTNRPSPIVVDGVRYESKTEACRKLGIPFSRVNGRLQSGWSIDEAFEITPRLKDNI
jgi:hypothetical protein